MKKASVIQSAARRWAHNQGKTLSELSPLEQSQVITDISQRVRGISAADAREALATLWSERNEQHYSASSSRTQPPAASSALRGRDFSQSALGVMLHSRTAGSHGTSGAQAMGSALEKARVPTVSLLLPVEPHIFGSPLNDANVAVHLGSINHMRLPTQTPLVAVLTPHGEKQVGAKTLGTMTALYEAFNEAEDKAPGMGQHHGALSLTMEWTGETIERVLIPREHFGAFISKYRQGIASGELPKSMGVVPYTAFFVASDDVDADLRAIEMRRFHPSFLVRSPEAQKVAAALAHRAASEAPRSVPYPLRLSVYEALIQHERIAPPPPQKDAHLQQLAREEKGGAQPFFHGTRDADAIVDAGFRAGDNNLMGKGIYYGNPSVAAQYANRGGASRQLDEEQIVSGRVLPGETAQGKLPLNEFFQSAVEPMPMEGGSYHVTRDPRRFQIRSVTTLDPATASQVLRDLLPDLLAVSVRAPDAGAWADRWLAAFPSDVLRDAAKRASDSTQNDDAQLGLHLALMKRADTAALQLVESANPDGFEPGALRCMLATSIDAFGDFDDAGRKTIRGFWNRCTAAQLDMAVADRMTSPLTHDIALQVLSAEAAPRSIQRVLQDARKEKMTAGEVRQQAKLFVDEAKAKVFCELGRSNTSLRDILFDAASIEVSLGGPCPAVAILLRTSQELDDGELQKWADALRERNPEQFEQIVLQQSAKDPRAVARCLIP